MLTFEAYLVEQKNIDANRGDIAEVILGAAVVARFKNMPYNKDVEESDIYLILRQIMKQNPTRYKRDDFQLKGRVSDTIRFQVGVPKKAYEFMKVEANWNDVKELFLSSKTYVNNDRRLKLQAKVLATNGKANDIFINSDGTGDQKGTKADIKLEIDGKPTHNQISLKVKGGDQFAQVSGIEFEKQITLWSKLGIDVKSGKKMYDSNMEKFDTEASFPDKPSALELGNVLRDSMDNIYKLAYRELKRKVESKDRKTIQAIGDFIKHGATLDDQTIELVKLEGGVFKRAKFGKRFYENLSKIDLAVEYKRTTDPIIKIYDKSIGSGNKGLLIQIRGKYAAESKKLKSGKVYRPYFRNIVEAGDLLFKIGTDF